MARIQAGEILRGQIANPDGVTREIIGIDNLLNEHLSWYEKGFLELILSLPEDNASIDSVKKLLLLRSLLEKVVEIANFLDMASEIGVVPSGVGELMEIVFDKDERETCGQQSKKVDVVLNHLRGAQ